MTRTRRTANKLSNSKILDLVKESYIGVIEDVDDPQFQGRCKVRVFGVFGDKNNTIANIPTADLPYAYPFFETSFSSSKGAGRFSSPKKGVVVRVIFEHDVYHPRYFSIEELSDEVQALIKDNYENFHSLVFDVDENFKIYYTKKSGFLINTKDSTINIDKDGAIILNHKNSSSTIEMRGDNIDVTTKNSVNVSTQNNVTINSNQVDVAGVKTNVGANAIYKAVNGDILMILLKAMATSIDAKYPTTPGAMTGLVNSLEQTILSQTVKTTP